MEQHCSALLILLTLQITPWKNYIFADSEQSISAALPCTAANSDCRFSGYTLTTPTSFI